jgi:N-acetylglucosamine kinase-like BadF-type ATPase
MPSDPSVAASKQSLILGVDGGGTKTVAWLSHPAEIAGHLGEGFAGPSNARAIGFPEAQRNIPAAIDAAFQAAGLNRAKVSAACLSLAGMGRASDRDTMLAWAVEQNIANRIEVTTDAEAVLAAASPSRVGIALICGTGSLAWGRNDMGQLERAGGWGYLLGDEGSAYGIAVAGLQAASRAIDHRGPKTLLVERFQERLQAPAPFDLIERIYNPAMTRDKIAALAEVVFDAEASDEIAATVLQQGAVALADCVTCVGHKLGFAAGEYPLGVAGGVIVSRERYLDAVLRSLLQRGYDPHCLELVPQPVIGALIIAGQMHLD